MIPTLSLDVVGSNYANAKGPTRIFGISLCRPGDPIKLVRELKHRADENAVAVFGHDIQLGYTDTFVANWFNGYGVMRWSDGREFHGEFAQDKPSGFGVIYQPDGSRYYVNYLNGDLGGTVLRQTTDGERRAGRWIGGAFVTGS